MTFTAHVLWDMKVSHLPILGQAPKTHREPVPGYHLPSHRQTADEEKANFYSHFVAGNISLNSYLDYSLEPQRHAGSPVKRMQLRITWSAVNTWWLLVNRYQRLFLRSELSVMYRINTHPSFIPVEKFCNYFHALKSEYLFSFCQNMMMRGLHHRILI